MRPSCSRRPGTPSRKMGIKVGKPTLDLGAMLKFKDEAVDGNVKGVDFLLKKNKVDAVRGVGRITGPGKVEVKGADGKTQTLETKNIVIATGSDVTRLKGIDIDEKRIVSSTGALTLGKVPDKLLVVGAGVIGLELGSVWRRLGAQVTVVEFLDRIVPGIDLDVAKSFQRLLEKQGIAFKLASKVTGVDASGKKLKATVEPAAGGAGETIEADVVLVAVGRVPYTEGLGLEEAGVKKDNRGRVVVDGHFATNVAGIYAIGDVIAGPMLAHKAEDEGVAVAEILAGQAGHVNYDVIPNVIYTYPELASVGKIRGGAQGGRRRLQRREIPVHRQRPRQGEPADRGLREDPGRRQDRPGARRAHPRRRRRQHDRGSRGGDGVRRGGGRHRPHLPRASDLARGGEGSRARGGQARDSYVIAGRSRSRGGQGNGQISSRQGRGHHRRSVRHRAGLCAAAGGGWRAYRHRRSAAGGRDHQASRERRPARRCSSPATWRQKMR